MIKPEEMDQVMFPYHHVTKFVVEEVGRLIHRERLNYSEVQNVLCRRYGLKVNVTTVGRWYRLYQCWMQATDDTLTPQYLEKLQELNHMIWEVDGSLGGMTCEVARVIEPLTRLHLASVPIEVKHGGRKEAYVEVLTQAKARFGTPVLIIRDGDTQIESAITEVFPDVEQQLCIFHLFGHIGGDFFNGLAKEFKSLLQKNTYRKALLEVTESFQLHKEEENAVIIQELLQLVEILLKPPVARYHYQPAILRKLDLFIDANAFLQKRLTLLKGHLPRTQEPSEELLTFRRLKSQCPSVDRHNWFTSTIIQGDAAMMGIIKIAAIVKKIVTDHSFKTLYKEWKKLHWEFRFLQSLFYEAFLDGLSALPDEPLKASTASQWEHKCLKSELERVQKKLSAIPQKNNYWKRVQRRPEVTCQYFALRRLNSLIKRWGEMSDFHPQLTAAIRRLTKNRHLLFNFCNYCGAVYHQQAIESDNATIKRQLKKTSGQARFGSRWIEHERALSQIANLEQLVPETTPAYRLGFSKAQIQATLYSIDWEIIKQYRERQRAASLPKILHRRVYHKGFASVFGKNELHWLQSAIRRIEEFLIATNAI